MIVMDEFHIAVTAPRRLPEATYRAMRRSLNGRRFRADLRRAVRDVFRRHPALRKARVTIGV